MSSTEQEGSLPQSDVTAQELLSRLLDLLGDARSMSDITFERATEAMGLPLQELDTGGWGYAARLGPDWSFGLEFGPESPDHAFEFDFQSGAVDKPMDDVGYLDYDAFANTLRASGYVRDGGSGAADEERFRRADILLRIQTRGGFNDLPDQLRHRYVHAISILPAPESDG